MRNSLLYRGYWIDEWRTPFGRFSFVSDEYTGDKDNRCGEGKTLEDCRIQIDEQLMEEQEWNHRTAQSVESNVVERGA